MTRINDACVLLDMPFTPDAALWAEAAKRYSPGSSRVRETLRAKQTWQRALAALVPDELY